MIDEWPDLVDLIDLIIIDENNFDDLMITDTKEDIVIYPGKRGPKYNTLINMAAIKAWESEKKRGKTYEKFSEDYWGFDSDGVLNVKKANFYAQRARILRLNDKKIKPKLD